MPAFTTLPIDTIIGSIGKRPSGAPLYRRGSQFGSPERRKFDRNLVAKILFLAEALDRRTRGPRQHGGAPLKAKGLDVLRALLKRFYCYATGECFPGYDEIAKAAGCCRATVAKKLRVLEQLGIIETIRRKVVTSFTGPVAKFFRARFVRVLRSAEPIPAQLWIEIRPVGIPIHNRKLGHPVVSHGSHTGREKFATGPDWAPGCPALSA